MYKHIIYIIYIINIYIYMHIIRKKVIEGETSD